MRSSHKATKDLLTIVGQKTFRAALVVLPFAALINIAFFVWSLDGRSFSEVARVPGWLILAILLSFLPWVTNGLRLAIWSRFFSLDLGFSQIARVILGTILGNAVTPTSTGGAAVKWALLSNENLSPDKATTLIGIQAAEDMLVSIGLIIAAISLLLLLEIPLIAEQVDWAGPVLLAVRTVIFTGFIILAITAILLAVLMSGLCGTRAKDSSLRLIKRIRLMYSRAGADWKLAFRTGRLYFLASLALGLLQWSVRHSIAMLIIGFAGLQMIPALHWVLHWLVITVSTIMPTPGGAGGTEAAFLLLYGPVLPSELHVTIMVIWRATTFYIPVAMASLFFLLIRRRKNQ